MNKKKSNPDHSVGRRVRKTTTEYDWSALEKKAQEERRAMREISAKREPTKLERKIRYQKRQKQKRLKKQRRRAAAVIIITTALILILLFLTPIFNIRSVSVDGNVLVSAEQFQEKLKPLVGENLFRSGSGKISKELKTIPYIADVQVQKRMFPPSVKVTVKEYTPVCIVRTEGKTLLISSGLNVLADNGDIPLPVPVVSGLEVEEYKVGGVLTCSDEEKQSALRVALSTMESVGIIDKTVEINLADTAAITLNYDNRITVICGSSIELERKLRLFKETITSNSLAENARGSMDLRESGKAVYTP